MIRPIPTQQAPGFYRRRFGPAIVTALSDGGIPSNTRVLQNIEDAEAQTLLAAAGRAPNTYTAINVFLVQTPKQTVLIDTGAGSLMGQTSGRLPEALAAAGVPPSDVDTVLLTHMHPDHVGGLLDTTGAPAFTNATVLAPAAELDFWLDESRAAAAPEAASRAFAAARGQTAPYGARLHPFTGSNPVPDIVAVPLPGHTPGHTGYAVGSGADSLLIWGDIVHAPDIQCYRPEVGVIFDIDSDVAIATRRAVLARAADEQLTIAGMHLHFPAFARIARSGEGYVVLPAAWQPEL